MTDRPRWREIRDGEVLLPGTRPVEIDGRRMVPDDDADSDDDTDDEEVGTEEAVSIGVQAQSPCGTYTCHPAGTAPETEADGVAHAPGNGLDPAAAAAAALREVAVRLVRLPKVEQELLQKTARERLGVSFAAMKAAIKEALEAEAKAAQAAMDAEAEASLAEDDPDIAPAEAPVETDDEVIARLAKLTPLDYERQREEAAVRLGCARVAILDRLVAAERGRGQPASAAVRGVKVAEPTPAADPVHLGTMLTAITNAIRRHVVLSPALAIAIALWTAHTWVYEHFQNTPRLCVLSPVRRCGKSTLMALLRVLCRRALKADNISASGTFRVVEALRPMTLLMDETDTFLPENEELRGVLNSGFERDGQVIRVVEIDGEHVPVGFSTYCPVALASIRHMPVTVADRAIRAELQRKRPDEKIEKLRLRGNKAALATLAGQLARWASDSRDRLDDNPATPEALDDRQGDISVPLLAIADFAGGDWPEQARAALLEIFGTDAGPDGDTGIRLLSDIRTILGDDRKSDRKIASRDLCEQLASVEEGPWSMFGRARKPISQEQLASLLRPYKIISGTIRLDTGKTPKGYKRAQFYEAWDRYMPPPGGSEPPQRHNPQKPAVFWPDPAATDVADVAAKNAGKLSNFNDVADVAGKTPQGEGYSGDKGQEDDSEVLV
jgi:hypothetical protein